MALDVVETLAELVRIPSVNPMGRSVPAGPPYYESRLTNRLVEFIERLGLPYERHCVAPERDNLLARFEGDPPLAAGGPLLMFEVHQDTVPVDGMTIDPFGGAVRENRVWGRGACDVKGGMAAMLAALVRLVEERPSPRPTIVLACTVNEEYGFSGAKALAKLWSEGTSRLLPRAPDGVIVAEPTELQAVICHRGSLRWRTRTVGKAAHSSQPRLGENAIYRMAPVLAAYESYAQAEVGALASHPLLGTPTLSVGMIQGGLSVNTVPDSCHIEIDRRLLPGEEPLAAWKHATEWLNGQLGQLPHVHHDPPHMEARALCDGDNGPLAERMLAAAKNTGISSRACGVPFATDASALSRDGTPCVVFGPGSIAQAHTADEWLAIDQLEAAAEALFRVAASGW